MSAKKGRSSWRTSDIVDVLHEVIANHELHTVSYTNQPTYVLCRFLGVYYSVAGRPAVQRHSRPRTIYAAGHRVY